MRSVDGAMRHQMQSIERLKGAQQSLFPYETEIATSLPLARARNDGGELSFSPYTFRFNLP